MYLSVQQTVEWDRSEWSTPDPSSRVAEGGEAKRHSTVQVITS